MKNLVVKGDRCSFELKHDFSLANAIRRSLLTDVETYAPYKVTFETNTSCQTDEYIAHRIGLIPFIAKPSEEEEVHPTVRVDVADRDLTTRDVVGHFAPQYDTTIMKLIPGQRITATIHFDKHTADTHARYSPVAGVGYEILDDKIVFAFESINGECPTVHLKKALHKMLSRLHNVRFQLDQEKCVEC